MDIKKTYISWRDSLGVGIGLILFWGFLIYNHWGSEGVLNTLMILGGIILYALIFFGVCFAIYRIAKWTARRVLSDRTREQIKRKGLIFFSGYIIGGMLLLTPLFLLGLVLIILNAREVRQERREFERSFR